MDIVTGKYEKNTLELKINNDVNTRGNTYKLYKSKSRLDTRKYLFFYKYGSNSITMNFFSIKSMAACSHGLDWNEIKSS